MSRLFCLEPEPTQFGWSRSRPNLVGAGVGSGTPDFQSRSRHFFGRLVRYEGSILRAKPCRDLAIMHYVWFASVASMFVSIFWILTRGREKKGWGLFEDWKFHSRCLRHAGCIGGFVVRIFVPAAVGCPSTNVDLRFLSEEENGV